MSRIPDQSKRSLWSQRLARFRKSGLSVARFCVQQNIPTHSFHYWAKQLAQHSQQAQSLEVELSAEQLPTPMTEGLRSASVSIHCQQYLTLTVPAHCVDTIRAILHELLRNGTGSDGCNSVVPQQASAGFQQVLVRSSLAPRRA